MSRLTSSQASAVLIAVLLVTSTVGAHQMRSVASTQRDATETYEDVYYLPPPAWLAVFSLGHREALADLIWMRALVYFGRELSERGAVRHVFQYGEAIVRLDADFQAAYRWVGMAGIYRPGEVSERDMRTAIGFLERGVAQFPQDGDMAWDLGATEMYELLPMLPNGPEKDALKLQAAQHMMRASRLGSGPDWLVLANATTLTRLGRTEQAARHLEEMYGSIRDPDVRAQIATQIAALRGRATQEAVARAAQELETGHQRDYPYLPLGLYVLVREPPALGPEGETSL